MSVVNPYWYEDLLIKLGFISLGHLFRPYALRDAGHINLLDTWGYDFMALGSPILYLVDRFSSLKNNIFWWSKRANKKDLIMDRNGNLLPAQT